MTDRPTRDEWFMEMAHLAAKRSTCPAAQVGAVIVRGDDIIAVGYNGAPRGMFHCDHEGCVVIESDAWVDYDGGVHIEGDLREYSRHVHAELNAILHCARTGRAVEGCTLYATLSPCLDCAKSAIQSGIKAVVVPETERGKWLTVVQEFLVSGGVFVRFLG